MLSECKTHIRLENSVIKGYHDYKIRPPNTDPVTRLLVDREYTNIHDICACLVWIPPLSTFPQCQHEILTDEKRHLLLKDVADLPVGHVPRELAGCFRAILDMGGGCVFCEPAGDPVPSFPPWPAPHEKGGGIVIPCHYVIYPGENNDIEQCTIKIIQALQNMPAGEFMRLVKC